MNNSNNFDINNIMNMLSKMDKKDLQASIQKANEIMSSNNKEQFINELKNKLKNS